MRGEAGAAFLDGHRFIVGHVVHLAAESVEGGHAVAFLPDIVLVAPWGRHDWGKSAMTALAWFGRKAIPDVGDAT